MARTKISEFSSTPASNTDIDSIFIGEGMAPSNVNDAIRELMSQLKDFQTGAQGDSFNGPIGSSTAVTGAFTTLTTTGNTGIGTSSPATRLHSTSSSNQLTISESSSLGATFDYQSSTGNLSIATNGINARSSAQLVLNLNGNLGLGVTPSAWGSGRKILQMTNGAAFGDYSGYTGLSQNYLYNGSDVYIANGYATRYLQGAGSHLWYTAASGTAGNAITFTQAMTLDANGNLGLGTTSTSGVRFSVDSGSTGLMGNFNSTNANGGYLRFQNSGTSIADIGTAAQLFSGSASDFGINVRPSGSLVFATFNTERARIDSSGNLLVRCTSSGFGNDNGTSIENGTVVQRHVNGTSSGSAYTYFIYNGSNIGSITQSGTTAVLYNVTSDYRLKNVIGSVTGQGARIDALQPIDYLMKADGSQHRGFLAHKFQEVYPNSVNGEKDAVDFEGNPVYQQMQSSTAEVIADLVAEIQSLRKRLADAGIA